MKKIVALSSFPHEFDYERQEFGKLADTEFIISPLKKPEEVIEVVRDADVILFTDVSMNADFLAKLEKCKLIIRYGIGYDNIDINAAAEKGIIVCNAPNYGVIDVAEHAVSLMLSCTKRLTYMSDCIRDKMWSTGDMGSSRRIYGKTIGFVGFGKIARCACNMTNAMGTKALVYDPYVTDEALAQYNAKSVDLDTLLKESDYVTLHLPLSEKTRHMFGAEEFAKMKNTAYLINTGRGGLVKEADLVEALVNGVIAGAGFDVFENESGELDSRMLTMKNVALTPHVAWNTFEGMEALHQEVTDNVVRFLAGNTPESIVNMKK